MLPEESLSARNYEHLVARLLELREEIDALLEMTDEQEREIRRAYSEAGHLPPEDLRDALIVEAGMQQIEIVRECLRRVDLGRLSLDSDYPETSLMLFACYRGDPPDPTSN